MSVESACVRRGCPLEPKGSSTRNPDQPSAIVLRTERRSWITLAITGFGALLLRYIKDIRERTKTFRTS